MIRPIFLIILLVYSFSATAENYTAIAMEAEKNRAQMAQEYLQYAEEAKMNAENNRARHFQNTSIIENKSNVIIFVSFSMPEQSIVNLLQDAKKIHASVVIRGLIHNSFKETFIKMASIVKKAGGGGVELNPPVFKKFNIEKVPAVVVLSNQNCQLELSCPEDKYDVVYGNIPLYDSLKLIRDHGTASNKIAEPLIFNMEASNHV